MDVGGLEYLLYYVFIYAFGGDGENDSTVSLYFSKSPNYTMVPISRTDTSLFDARMELYFVIHGFNEHYTYYVYQDLARTLAATGAMVIVVDWAELAKGMNYFRAVKNVPLVANLITNYIVSNNLDPSNIRIAGFSLGAHMAGLIGKQLMKIAHVKTPVLDRIIGLDPAGPLYGIIHAIPAKYRLDENDAKSVVTISTNSYFFATRFRFGKVNFVANGGSIQPGCFGKELQTYNWSFSQPLSVPPFLCSHRRSIVYYNISIGNSNFIGRNAKGGSLAFGNNIPYKARGTYYFRTGSEPPYAVG